jgi:hypothetical protein
MHPPHAPLSSAVRVEGAYFWAPTQEISELDRWCYSGLRTYKKQEYACPPPGQLTVEGRMVRVIPGPPAHAETAPIALFTAIAAQYLSFLRSRLGSQIELHFDIDCVGDDITDATASCVFQGTMPYLASDIPAERVLFFLAYLAGAAEEGVLRRRDIPARILVLAPLPEIDAVLGRLRVSSELLAQQAKLLL